MGLRDTLTNLRKWSKRDKNDPQAEQNSTTTPSKPMPAQQPQTSPVQAKELPPELTPQSFQVPTRTNTTTGSQSSMTLTDLALLNLRHIDAAEKLQRADYEAKKREEEQQAISAAMQAQQAPPPKCGMEGEIINGLYRIERLIAQGGMGQVFLATHLGKEPPLPIVLKLLLKQTDENSVEYNRFIQEMLISGRMKHPNLVKVYDYGILLEGLKPYLVMEYVDGVPLRDVLRQYGSLPVADAAQIIIQACDALHEVHEKSIVHRDLKPENLMIRSNDYRAIDNVKILDFGIAHVRCNSHNFKPDEEGLAVGSVGYMSPEQICAQPVDHRTDIYSLGLIFYETITGHPPFVGGTRRETMAMHVQAKHMPPSAMASLPCPEVIDAIVDRALAKHPDNRFQHVRELENVLKELLAML
jgi:serine/threonine-protein kinase